MLRFIIWMILVYIAAKIVGQLIRVARFYFTPNKDIKKHQPSSSASRSDDIEDIPYEEIKDQK